MPTTAKLVLDVDAKGVEKADKALDGLDQGAKKATKSTKKLAGTTRQAATATEKLAKSTADLKTKVSGLVATYLGLAAAVKSVSLVGEFEEASQTVLAIGQAAKASAADLESLSAQTRELGATTRFTATQVAEAQVNLLRAGLASNEVLASTANVLNLATAAQLDLARAAEIAAITQKQFGLEASQSERIVDVLVATSNSAATTVEQLAEALKFSAPVAAGFGATLEQTSAALAVLSNAGLQASLAGTGLRGIFARLAGPTGMAAAQIQKLASASGQLVDDFDITKRSLEEVFKAFKKAETGPKEFLKIFGRLQTPAALALSNGIEELGKFQDRLTDIAGEAETTADTINNTLKKSFLDLEAALTELVLSINDEVGPAFRSFVEFTTDVTRALSGVRDSSGETNTAAAVLAATLRIATDILAAYAIQWAAVRVQTLLAKSATLGFIGTLRGLKAAVASTGIGLFAVAFGELFVFISDSLSATEELTDKYNDQGEAAKEAAKGVDELTGALKRNREEADKATSDFDRLQARINSMAVETRKFVGEAHKLQGGLDLAFSTDVMEAFSIVLKEGLSRGLAFGDAQRIAAKSTRTFTRELEANTAAQFALNRIKQEADEETETEDPNKKLIEFLDKLRSELSDSTGFDKMERRIGRLQDKFSDLASSVEPLSVELFISGMVEIERLVRQIDANKAFANLKEDSEAAGESIQSAFEDAQAALSAVGRDPAAQILVDTQREFAEAIQITTALLTEQVARGEISREQADRELAARQRLIGATAQLRQEEMARMETLAREVELQAELEGSISSAEETMRALSDAVGGSTSALDQFREAAIVAMTGYREQMMLAGADTAALQAQIDATAESFDKFAEKLARKEVFASLESVLATTTRAYFDLFETIISGTKTAGEAFGDFIKVIIRALLEKFVIEQIINSISSALKGISAGSSLGGGLAALPSVVSAQGNVFENGDVKAFRDGGIIGGPTLFPLGLAGEAGPEAILPLARGPNGQLGVQTSGGERTGRRPGSNPFLLRSLSPGASDAPTAAEVRTGTSRTTNVQFNVTTPDANSFRKSSRQMQAEALRSARIGN